MNVAVTIDYSWWVDTIGIVKILINLPAVNI